MNSNDVTEHKQLFYLSIKYWQGPAWRLVWKVRSYGIHGKHDEWKDSESGNEGLFFRLEAVTSGVPQGFLCLQLFVIHINDLHDNIIDMVDTFRDDAKISGIRNCEGSYLSLQ